MARGNRQKDRSHTFVGRQTNRYRSRRRNEACIFETDNITLHCQSIRITSQTCHQSASESASAVPCLFNRHKCHSPALQMCNLVPQNAFGHRRCHASTTKCLAPTFHRQHEDILRLVGPNLPSANDNGSTKQVPVNLYELLDYDDTLKSYAEDAQPKPQPDTG
jgi:hypothetical protein